MSLRDPKFYDTKLGKLVKIILSLSFLIAIAREAIVYISSLF